MRLSQSKHANDAFPKLSNTLYKSYRVHGAWLLRCIGIGCSRMALVGCTQMAADMTGLLQRMLPRLDDTHRTVCIAVSKLDPTPPPDEAAIAKCDFLNPNTKSMQFQNFPTLCTNPTGCTELCCSDALGSDAIQWLWSAALKRLRTQLGCCNGCYQH